MTIRHENPLFFVCRRISPQIEGKCLHMNSCRTRTHTYKSCRTSTQTHQSRQPIRVVGYIKSELSLLYAMASSFNSRIKTARAPTRGIGQRQLAGLKIVGQK